MSIVVVGSIAFDTINTPSGFRKAALGGSANYFSVSASFFGPVKMVGVVGEDFPEDHLRYLAKKGVDIQGVERVAGRSFHWHGEYGADLNIAKTLKTELNVFERFSPKLPESYLGARTLFLANIHPQLQIHVLDQMTNAKIRALDTMNLWIKNTRAQLLTAISKVDILLVNDAEIRLLSGEHNIVKATTSAHKMGARVVVVKRGEYGAMVSFDNNLVIMPAYPCDDVNDPTGAGDTFAGGFISTLHNEQKIDMKTLRRALISGAVMSSFVVENFSFDRLLEISTADIAARQEQLTNMINPN